MKIRQIFVVFATAFALTTFAFAEEIPVENPDPYVSLFQTLKRAEGKGVYEPKISVTELAKRERQDVEANHEVLAQLRILMKESVQEVNGPLDDSGFQPMGHMREFARLLSRESKVRLADGDSVGAMQSRLDCFQLAVIQSRGGRLIDSLSAAAIEAIAWKDLEQIGSKLDGKSCVEFFNRIEEMKLDNPAYITVLQNEKTYSLTDFRRQSKKFDWKDMSTKTWAEMFTSEEVNQLRTLSPEQVEASFITAYDKLISDAKKPFSAVPTAIKTTDAYSEMIMSVYSGDSPRFNFERAETATRLVQAALLLRARKLGELSELEFERLLPYDPFSQNQLIRKDFIIYSVGPDGKNDGGKPIKNTDYRFDPVTGRQVKITSTRPQFNSKGDIIAPNFVTTP